MYFSYGFEILTVFLMAASACFGPDQRQSFGLRVGLVSFTVLRHILLFGMPHGDLDIVRSLTQWKF